MVTFPLFANAMAIACSRFSGPEGRVVPGAAAGVEAGAGGSIEGDGGAFVVGSVVGAGGAGAGSIGNGRRRRDRRRRRRC